MQIFHFSNRYVDLQQFLIIANSLDEARTKLLNYLVSRGFINDDDEINFDDKYHISIYATKVGQDVYGL